MLSPKNCALQLSIFGPWDTAYRTEIRVCSTRKTKPMLHSVCTLVRSLARYYDNTTLPYIIWPTCNSITWSSFCVLRFASFDGRDTTRDARSLFGQILYGCERAPHIFRSHGIFISTERALSLLSSHTISVFSYVFYYICVLTRS